MSTTSTILSLSSRTLSKMCCSFNLNRSTMRRAMKQCEISKSTKIVIRRSLTMISKRSHAFDLRWSFLFKTVKNINWSCCWFIDSYESFDLTMKIQDSNVLSSDRHVTAFASEIWSFSVATFSLDVSSCFTTLKSDAFESTNCSCSYDSNLFSKTSYETFSQSMRDLKRVHFYTSKLCDRIDHSYNTWSSRFAWFENFFVQYRSRRRCSRY